MGPSQVDISSQFSSPNLKQIFNEYIVDNYDPHETLPPVIINDS